MVHALEDPFFEGKTLSELFTPGTFTFLAQQIETGQYVTRRELRDVKRAYPTAPVPMIVQEYEKRLNAGKVKRPGRPTKGFAYKLRVYIARDRYPILLRYLKMCKRRGGFPSQIKGIPIPTDGPMHQRAAEMLRMRLFPSCDWRHVLNLVKQNRGPLDLI